MKTPTDSAETKAPGQITSLTVLGARLSWVCFGPFALMLATFGIVVNGTGWFTPLDGFFGIVVGLMLFGRWVEHRSGEATTAMGEPASDAQFHRYRTWLPLVAIGWWTVANFVGNHVLA